MFFCSPTEVTGWTGRDSQRSHTAQDSSKTAKEKAFKARSHITQTNILFISLVENNKKNIQSVYSHGIFIMTGNFKN